jgi:CRISPR type I-E-associated protein CasB/Cse2
MSDYHPQTVFLKRLSDLNIGERARLKRCAGQTLSESREVFLFSRLLPNGVSKNQEAIYFLIATLYPMAENTGEGDFGTSLRKVKNENNHKGLDKRVQVLLDSDEIQLPFRLRQLIHLIKSKQVKVNWQNLLEDLLWWNSQERAVQRRWARNYFAE